MSACLETHVKSFDRMGERTHRHEIYSALGIVANGVEGDSAARFCLILAANHFNGLAGVLNAEVIEHDAVNAAALHHLTNLVEGAHLNLNLQVQSFLLKILVATGDCILIFTACFSSMRMPGVVLRVSSTWVFVPFRRST